MSIHKKHVSTLLPTRQRLVPIENWEEFLYQAKKDFNGRFGLKSRKKNRKSDFEFIMMIGEGSFGRVYLARMLHNQKYYAIKVLDKSKVSRRNQAKHIISERRILQALNFPFCIYLETSFKDNSYLYMCLPFIAGGEMFRELHLQRKFRERVVRFYGAQVLLAFEYLHYCDMVFRDLKPENILIDINGYLKLTDFGFCKLVGHRTYTICGTPDYLAPEILQNKGYGKSVDYWSYGVLLYEMAVGHPPFHAKNQMKIYQKSLSGSYHMPKKISRELADLIENILQVDVTRRYGCMVNGIGDIKNHCWFSSMDWIALFNRKINAPYLPRVRNPGDTRYFSCSDEVNLVCAKKDYYCEEFIDF